MNIEEKYKINEAIKKLLITGAIKYSPEESGQFISNIFSVPKHDNSIRLVINLKPLNNYIIAPHFKMEDYRTAITLLCPNNFMSNIDLKEAYHCIPISYEYQKYLKFRWNGILYQFTCLPFGLNIAPYVFTKVLRPVVAHLRQQKWQSVIFLDDCLVFSNTEEKCKDNVKFTIEIFEKLGFTINREKSQLTPCKVIRFLGFIYDTEEYVLRLPKDKEQIIMRKLLEVKNSSKLTIQVLAGLIGILLAACPTIMYGPVYVKQLEYEKNKALEHHNKDFSRSIVLSQSAKEDINWWICNLPQAKNSMSKDKYDTVITTDASLSGWGGESKGKTTKGSWSQNEKGLHINELELMAIYFCLQALIVDSNINILIRCDNTTAISYINNQGGCRATGCNTIANNIWKWSEQRGIFLFATYINTKINLIADALSREDKDSSDFMLNKKYFNRICREFYNPQIDLFATRLTAQCNDYVSWLPDPSSIAVDAFTIRWTKSFYAFPPFCLLPRVINKILEDNAEGIVVAPLWMAQPWYPLFLNLCKSKILTFHSKNLLWCPYENRTHNLSSRLTLMAAVLSANP